MAGIPHVGYVTSRTYTRDDGQPGGVVSTPTVKRGYTLDRGYAVRLVKALGQIPGGRPGRPKEGYEMVHMFPGVVVKLHFEAEHVSMDTDGLSKNIADVVRQIQAKIGRRLTPVALR